MVEKIYSTPHQWARNTGALSENVCRTGMARLFL